MSTIGKSSELANLSNNQLFPLHLYQKRQDDTHRDKAQLLDENYHDKSLPAQTKLQEAKQSLKIGDDTVFDTPVEDFGSKILTNLGWKEGFGIGKDSTQSSAPIEYIPRQFRLGLGAKALTADQVTSKRQLTVTENYEASSLGKNIKRVGEQLKLKLEMVIGSKVLVTGGTHEGLRGEVLAMKKQSALAQDESSAAEQYVSVQLAKSGATVQIKRKRLNLQRERSRSPTAREDLKDENDRQEDRHAKQRKPLQWIREGIIVRCVSKSCYDGTLYGKELHITAVLSELAFEAKVDGKIYSDLRERDLETVLPSGSQIAQHRREDVLILRGSSKGKQGKVLHVDKKRDRVEVQVEYVRVVQVGQDDVSCLYDLTE